MKVLCVIPARYKSSRFEGKPLVPIAGIPMIKRTFSQASKSQLLTDLVVATDDARVVEYCQLEGIPVQLTSGNCLTGTDRVAEVAETRAFDFYINVQGDEPVIDPACIDQLLQMYKQHGDKYHAYNLYKYITDQALIDSKTIIKVITNQDDELLYMSRLPVPYSQSGLRVPYKHQVPVYGFTRDALRLFASVGKTINEMYEDIELLRFVDLGFKILMQETQVSSIAVDVPEDVGKVEDFLDSKGSQNDAEGLENGL